MNGSKVSSSKCIWYCSFSWYAILITCFNVASTSKWASTNLLKTNLFSAIPATISLALPNFSTSPLEIGSQALLCEGFGKVDNFFCFRRSFVGLRDVPANDLADAPYIMYSCRTVRILVAFSCKIELVWYLFGEVQSYLYVEVWKLMVQRECSWVGKLQNAILLFADYTCIRNCSSGLLSLAGPITALPLTCSEWDACKFEKIFAVLEWLRSYLLLFDVL